MMNAHQEEMEQDARKSFFPVTKADGPDTCWEINGGFKVRTVTVDEDPTVVCSSLHFFSTELTL